MQTQQMIEFVPAVIALAIPVLVRVLALPVRRFAFPFAWATLGMLSARFATPHVVTWLDVENEMKAEVLILFQGATVLSVIAIATGEWLRRAGFHWRPLVATLGILSVPMMMLASHLLNGGGPRVYDLGTALVWVAAIGYLAGPAALAAFVYLLGVHRMELYKELGH
jgi:hypothetical protein